MAESIAPNGSPSRRQDLAFDCQDSFPDQETLRRHQSFMNQYRDHEESHPLIVSSPSHGVTDNNNRINEQQSRETVKAKGKREHSAQNYGQSSSNNTEGSSNGPDKENNVLKKIWLPCPHCKNVFDREEEFYHHHAVKHAKHGDPPAVTPIIDIISKPPPEAKSNVIQQRWKSDVLRTPRPNVSYNVDQEYLDDSSSDSSSADSDEKHDDISKLSTYKKNDETEKQPGKIYRTKSNKSSYSKSGSKSSDCEQTLMALMLRVFKISKRRRMIKKLLKSRHRKKLLQKRSKRDETIKCQKCKVGIAKLDFERHMKMCKKIRHGKNTDNGTPSSESENHSSYSKSEENINKKKDKKKSKTPDRANSRKHRASQHSEAEDINNATRKRDHAHIESANKKPKTHKSECSSDDIFHNKRAKLEKPGQQNEIKIRKLILYRCGECDGHFSSKKSLLSHIKPGIHFGVRHPECPECKLKFSSRKKKYHKELHHEQLT